MEGRGRGKKEITITKQQNVKLKLILISGHMSRERGGARNEARDRICCIIFSFIIFRPFG